MVEAQVSVHSGFEGLKVKSVGKDGSRERVLVHSSHGVKRIGEQSGLGLFQFNSEMMLGFGKSQASVRFIEFQLIRAHGLKVSIKQESQETLLRWANWSWEVIRVGSSINQISQSYANHRLPRPADPSNKRFYAFPI